MSTKTTLGRRHGRPKSKAVTIFILFQRFFFTYLSASFQRHLAGTPIEVTEEMTPDDVVEKAISCLKK